MPIQRSLQRRIRRRRPAEAVAPPSGGIQRQQLNAVLRRVQTKLRVGSANDPQEREADSVADQVMRMPSSIGTIQRQCRECAQEELQRQAPEQDKDEELQAQRLQRQSAPQEVPEEEEQELQAKGETASGAEGGPVGADIAGRISQRQGGGQPLPATERGFFEPRFGANFSDVRVHSDPEAQQISRAVGARAFTLGNAIYFGAGEYRPGEGGGRQLMAHELTHTLQQRGDNDVANRVIRRYRDSSSVNFGVKDTSSLKEKEFNSRTPDPYIKKITVAFDSTVKLGGETVPKGKLSATYASNSASPMPANISGIPIVGGYPSQGLSDKGTNFKIHRIEGYGYHHVAAPKGDRVGDKWPEYKYFKPAKGGSATMSFALFFKDHQAIHYGSLSSGSLACVHVDQLDTMRQLNYHSREDVTKADVTYTQSALKIPCCERAKAKGYMVSNPCGGQDKDKCP